MEKKKRVYLALNWGLDINHDTNPSNWNYAEQFLAQARNELHDVPKVISIELPEQMVRFIEKHGNDNTIDAKCTKQEPENSDGNATEVVPTTNFFSVAAYIFDEIGFKPCLMSIYAIHLVKDLDEAAKFMRTVRSGDYLCGC